MKSLSGALADIRPHDPGLYPDDDRCEQCRVYHDPTACGVCHGAGRVRLNYRVGDPNFGKAIICGACGGTGVERRNLPAEQWEAADNALEEEFVRRSHIDRVFQRLRLGTWLPEDDIPRRECEAFASEWPPQRPLMLFSGESGRGKSGMACATIRAVWERHNVIGQFFPWVQLVQRYRNAMDKDARETGEAIDRLLEDAPLLVLDDYGADSGTQWAEERIFAAIDTRWRQQTPLIVTTNIPVGKVPERIFSRMSDVETSRMVVFDGPDRRQLPHQGEGARK